MKVWLKEAPVPRLAEVQLPSDAVTVWLALSWLVQVTVVPTLTVRVAGAKANPEIEIFAVLAGGLGLLVGVAGTSGSAGAVVRVGECVLVRVAVGRTGLSVRVAVRVRVNVTDGAVV